MELSRDRASATTAWWPVALSEDVTGDKPLGVVCKDEPIVLFRDAQGVVRALEDRCPHRRAPLSLGRMKNGALQCGYHGWTFEGETGGCVAIPNLRPEEKVPPRYRAEPYAVTEQDGFVQVRLGADAGEPPTTLPRLALEREFTGSTIVSLHHEAYVAAMLDGPELLLEIPGLSITDYVFTDQLSRDGRLSTQRGVALANPWSDFHVSDLASILWRNHRFLIEYPFILDVTVAQPSGLTTLELRTESEEPVLFATIATAPAGRGATAVRWRGGVVATPASGKTTASLRRRAVSGRPPLRVFDHVDGAALSNLLVGPSRRWRETLLGGNDVFAPQAA